MKGGPSALSEQVTKAEVQDSGLNTHTTHLCDAHGLTVRRGTEFCEMQMGVGTCVRTKSSLLVLWGSQRRKPVPECTGGAKPWKAIGSC